MSPSQHSGNSWRLIGAILLILLLLLLWLMGYGPGRAGCCGAEVAAKATAPTPAAAPAPAKVNASWADGKLTLMGEVASESDKKRLVDAAVAAYGAAHVNEQLTVKSGLGAVSGVTLTGIVPSDAEKATRGEVASKAFAPLSVDNQLSVQAPVAATDASKAPDCSKAMQLQVQFATGSAQLTAASTRYLDDVVSCISSPMLVGGHTDNRGSDATNARLSAARAEAVKAYLVSKGVKAELLSAEGFGASKPIADNSSADGRAKNRRIELNSK